MGRRLISTFLTFWVIGTHPSGHALAADPVLPTNYSIFWNGTPSVVIAEVLHVQRDDPRSSSAYQLKLGPIACVGGTFNPAANPSIVMDMLLGSGIWVLPKTGDMVLAVIIDRTKLAAPRPGFGLSPRCEFMPETKSLVVLKGHGRSGDLRRAAQDAGRSSDEWADHATKRRLKN